METQHAVPVLVIREDATPTEGSIEALQKAVALAETRILEADMALVAAANALRELRSHLARQVALTNSGEQTAIHRKRIPKPR